MFEFTRIRNESIFYAYQDVEMTIGHRSPLFFVTLQVMMELLFKQIDIHLNHSRRITDEKGLGCYVSDLKRYSEGDFDVEHDPFLIKTSNFFTKENIRYLASINNAANSYKHNGYFCDITLDNIKSDLLFVHDLTTYVFQDIFHTEVTEPFAYDEIDLLWNNTFPQDQSHSFNEVQEEKKDATHTIHTINEASTNPLLSLPEQLEKAFISWMGPLETMDLEVAILEVINLTALHSELFYSFLIHRSSNFTLLSLLIRLVFAVKLGDVEFFQNTSYQKKLIVFLASSSKRQQIIQYLYKTLPGALVSHSYNESVWIAYLDFLYEVDQLNFINKTLTLTQLKNDEGVMYMNAKEELNALKKIKKELKNLWPTITTNY